MARHTATLYDIIQSELINRGFNEFENDGKFTFFENEYSFIKKIMQYDDDVEKIVNEIIFQNEKLHTPESDKHFKKMFINRFLNKSINRQTVESFSSQVMYTFLQYEDYINNIYNIDDFLAGKSQSVSKGNSNRINDNRMLHSELPQSEVNIDLNDTNLNYPTTNTISRSKDEGVNENISEGKQFNLDTLVKSNSLLDFILSEFDKNCFMQVF